LIQYSYFNQFIDFYDKNKPKKPKNPNRDNAVLQVPIGAVYNAIVSVGRPYKPSNSMYYATDIVQWKVSMVHAFFEEVNDEIAFKNLELLEGSEKTNLGYFIGMTFAHIFVQFHFQVRYTQHLSEDPNLKVYHKNSLVKKFPDLWAKGPDNSSYLIEAKGSTVASKTYMDNKFIKQAHEQLESVSSIEFITGNRTETYNETNCNLKKLIVAAYPTIKTYPLKRRTPINHSASNRVYLNVIDPEGKDSEKIKIYGSEMIYKYYHFITKLLIENMDATELKNLQQYDFILYSVPGMSLKIGMLKQLFDRLRLDVIFERLITQNNILTDDDFRKSESYDYFNELLDRLEIKGTETFLDDVSGMTYFIGIDGLISMYVKEHNEGLHPKKLPSAYFTKENKNL